MKSKVTSSKVAKIASKILKDNRYSQSAKSVAGSALSQKEKKRSNFSVLGVRATFNSSRFLQF